LLAYPDIVTLKIASSLAIFAMTVGELFMPVYAREQKKDLGYDETS